jgi:Tfp pilus tip-associated adhesin PilY1
MPTSFTTNLNSITTINRSQPLTVTWTGTGFDQVIIMVTGAILTTTTTDEVSVSCAVPASLGTYSIPAAALAYLPAVAAGAQNVGQLSLTASPNAGGTASAESSTSTSLTPPLVAGGQVDFGAFTPYIFLR